MLPPVQSVSNSQVSYQEQRQPHVRETSYPSSAQQSLPVAPPGVDQNSAIAGKLSLLLLSGQERMSANLVVLADLLGRALGLQRRDSETNASFSTRLTEALAKLTPAEVARVERQLSQAFSGVQLRMIVEAFRNPAGPDAAKLSVFLELARYKDRDLAARTVVTSYRQYSGEPRMLAAGLPSVVFLREEPAAPRMAAALPTADDGEAAPLLPSAAAEGEKSDEPVKAPAGPFARPGSVTVIAGQLSQGAEGTAETLRGASAEPEKRGDDFSQEAADASVGESEDGSPHTDIRILQDRLRRNFEDGRLAGFPETAAETVADRQNNIKTQLAPAARPDTEMLEAGEPAERQAVFSAPVAERGSKAMEQAVSKALQLLPAGDLTGEMPKEILPERALKALMQAATEDPAQADPSVGQDEAERDAGMPIVRNAKDMPLAEAEAAIAGTDKAEHGRPGTEAAARPSVLPQAELALLRQGVIPQGLPLPFINYIIAPEYDTGSAKNDAGHRFDEESESEEEAADGEFADGESEPDEHPLEDAGQDSTTEADIDAKVMLDESPVLAITVEKVATDADRITDLYGRMAV